MNGRDLDRFLDKVEALPDGCWRWNGAHNSGGYGRIWMGGAVRQAHRVSYEYFIGPIAEGLEPDHLCGHRYCVNPLHLEPVTHLVNMNRARLGFATPCKRGHSVTRLAIRITETGQESRHCLECANERRYGPDRRRRVPREREIANVT